MTRKERPFSLLALHLGREEADGLGVIAVDDHRIVALTTRNIIQPALAEGDANLRPAGRPEQ